ERRGRIGARIGQRLLIDDDRDHRIGAFGESSELLGPPVIRGALEILEKGGSPCEQPLPGAPLFQPLGPRRARGGQPAHGEPEDGGLQERKAQQSEKPPGGRERALTPGSICSCLQDLLLCCSPNRPLSRNPETASTTRRLPTHPAAGASIPSAHRPDPSPGSLPHPSATARA